MSYEKQDAFIICIRCKDPNKLVTMASETHQCKRCEYFTSLHDFGIAHPQFTTCPVCVLPLTQELIAHYAANVANNATKGENTRVERLVMETISSETDTTTATTVCNTTNTTNTGTTTSTTNTTTGATTNTTATATTNTTSDETTPLVANTPTVTKGWFSGWFW